MTKTIDRIKEIAASNDITLTEMERIIGASKGVLTRAASKGTNIQLRWLEAIADKFPAWNAEWIITGRGEQSAIKSISLKVIDDAGKIIYSDNDANNIDTKVDMYATKDHTPEISYTDGTPYYDVDFECGFDELIHPGAPNPECLIRMPGYEKATMWCNATGRSMEPEISNGDIIALQKIDDISFLPFGAVYAIVTTNGLRTIKRLGRSEIPGCYKLIPTNPDYDSQDIPVKMIYCVYRVMGSMKSF